MFRKNKRYPLLMFYFSISVHPCDRKDIKACEQVCNKNGDKAECSCNKDFKLKADNKTCEEGKKDFFELILQHSRVNHY